MSVLLHATSRKLSGGIVRSTILHTETDITGSAIGTT